MKVSSSADAGDDAKAGPFPSSGYDRKSHPSLSIRPNLETHWSRYTRLIVSSALYRFPGTPSGLLSSSNGSAFSDGADGPRGYVLAELGQVVASEPVRGWEQPQSERIQIRCPRESVDLVNSIIIGDNRGKIVAPPVTGTQFYRQSFHAEDAAPDLAVLKIVGKGLGNCLRVPLTAFDRGQQ